MINGYFLKFISKNFHLDNPTKKVKLNIDIKLLHLYKYINYGNYCFWIES